MLNNVTAYTTTVKSSNFLIGQSAPNDLNAKKANEFKAFNVWCKSL